MADPTRQVVLVVDDEPVVLSLIETILTRAGYSVFTASTAAAALEICKRHGKEISLALLDYMIPGMNGPELVKCLQDLQPALRIAMMSGYPRGHLEDLGVPFLNYSFLPKPFAPAQLLAFVKQSIESESPRSAVS